MQKAPDRMYAFQYPSGSWVASSFNDRADMVEYIRADLVTCAVPKASKLIQALSTAKMDSKHDHLNALMDEPAVDAGELERAIWYCREDWQHKDGYEALYEHMDIIIKAARAHLEKSKGGV